MTSLAFYVAAAVVEIGGCFAFWASLRIGKSVYWILPGIMSLVIFSVFLPVLSQYLQVELLQPMVAFT
jgi:small multidrug resistance family-3 protein